MTYPYVTECSNCHVSMRRKNRLPYVCNFCKGNSIYPRGWDRVKREFRKSTTQECVICKTNTKLHIHHKDGNKMNCKTSNLEYRCQSCHPSHHLVGLDKEIVAIRRGRFGTRLTYKHQLII